MYTPGTLAVKMPGIELHSQCPRSVHSDCSIPGIFTASVPGVYTVTVNAFSSGDSFDAKLRIVVDRVDGSGTQTICSAHVAGKKNGAATCGSLVELVAGDRIWCIGQGGKMDVYSRFANFYAYLLYKADVLA